MRIKNNILWFGLLCVFLFPQKTLSQSKIWLETEHFRDLGGWTIDWQFIDQMGSPFLMSIGYGKPVDSAKTVIDISEEDDYQLWIRTRDWVPGHQSGSFSVVINGDDKQRVYGVNNMYDWGWEKGPIFHLKGHTKVELKDLSGYYGRCDAIVLSSDLNWTPPVDKKAIERTRTQYSVVKPKKLFGGNYDVVVIGGGLSGCLAAVSAARTGAKTVLIQNRGELGGNASTENFVPPVGSTNQRLQKDEIKYNPRESGLIEEVALPFGPQSYEKTGKNWPFVLERLIKSEPNLDLYLCTHAADVIMKNSSEIQSVECVQVPSGQKISFKGKIFIDCTGNGIVGLSAGAEYMYGIDSKDEFNESMAPQTRSSKVMPSSLKYWYEATSDSVKYQAPSWAFEYKDCKKFIEPEKHLSFGAIDRQWIVELGGDNDSLWVNAEKVRDDLFKLIYGIWNHQKNYCTKLKVDAWKYKLAWVSHVLGVRESYRLAGDYIMKEEDITSQVIHRDRVAYGGWGLDNHATSGYTENVRVERSKNHTFPGSYFSIPYRSLYSKNIQNLMMGGRNISQTHLALSATRVMYTTSVIGQATGTAAGLCINYNCFPRDIYNDYLEDLQQKLIKDGAYLIEKRNNDSNDLGLKATSFSASSGKKTAHKVINGYSRARLTSIFSTPSEPELNAWCPDTDGSKENWLQMSWDSEQEFNVLHINFLTSRLSAKKITVEALIEGKWQKISSVNNTLPARRILIPFEKVRTSSLKFNFDGMPKDAGVCEIRVYNESKNIVRQIERANYTMSLPDSKIVHPWD